MRTPEYNYRQVLESVFDKIKNCLRVCVVNTALDPIPVTITSGVAGAPFYSDFDGIPSGVGPHDLVSFTVGAGKTRLLSRLHISCRIESKAVVTQNGTVIANLRTGAARPSDSFEWNPQKPCVAGDIIKVTLTKRAGSSDNDIGVHLMGTEV